MGKIYKKVCKVCGEHFETEQSCKRYCTGCVKNAARNRQSKERQEYKKPEAENKLKRARRVRKKVCTAPDMRRCKDCFYGAILDGNYQICDYISIMGHSRPCLPGADCTIFEPKEKGKQKPRKQFTLAGPGETEFGSYVQDSIFRTEKRRRNR